MRISDQTIRKLRILFGWGFIVSTALVVLSIVAFLASTMFRAKGGPPVAHMIAPGVVQWLALLISLASLIGYVLTSVLSIRREARDARIYTLDLERKQLEIEKLRLELEEARRQGERRPRPHISEELDPSDERPNPSVNDRPGR